MKKIVSALLVCVLLVGSIFSLSSCNVVQGKYGTDDVTIEFTMFGKVTVTREIGSSITATYEAEYSIEENDDGELEISFEYDDDADKDIWINGTKSFVKGEENGTKYIEIGGVRYNKK